jgi:hypothetical protein
MKFGIKVLHVTPLRNNELYESGLGGKLNLLNIPRYILPCLGEIP